MQSIKIAKMDGFATPTSVKEIEDWINMHPPEDRAHLYTVMGMTWNLLAGAADAVATYGGDENGGSTRG